MECPSLIRASYSHDSSGACWQICATCNIFTLRHYMLRFIQCVNWPLDSRTNSISCQYMTVSQQMRIFYEIFPEKAQYPSSYVWWNLEALGCALPCMGSPQFFVTIAHS